jgi:hypothetical protein
MMAPSARDPGTEGLDPESTGSRGRRGLTDIRFRLYGRDEQFAPRLTHDTEGMP